MACRPAGTTAHCRNESQESIWDYGEDALLLDQYSDIEAVPKKHPSRLSNTTSAYLLGVTIATGGLQVIWSTLSGHGSMYLSSLGLPNHMIAFIWLGGPFSGVVVQPYICYWSDRCSHAWGRRTPFVVFGTLVTVVSMLSLPWSAEITAYLLRRLNFKHGDSTTLLCNGLVAGTLTWTVNLAMQPVQMGIRALLCESVSKNRQIESTAYSSCVGSVGMILGYAIGTSIPWSAQYHFKYLCGMASAVMAITVMITLSVVEDKPLFSVPSVASKGYSPVQVIRQYRKDYSALPFFARQIYHVQFFAWLGWLPFLYYITTYLADLYKTSPIVEGNNVLVRVFFPKLAPSGSASYTMLFFGIAALCSNAVLLRAFRSPRRSAIQEDDGLSNSSAGIGGCCMNDRVPEGDSTGPADNRQCSGCSPATWSVPVTRSATRTRLTLPRAWSASHLLTASILLSTAFTQSTIISSLLVMSLGLSWSLTQWVPMALINTAVIGAVDNDGVCRCAPSSIPCGCVCCTDPEKMERFGKKNSIQVGTVMGLYNLSIALPQVLATLGCSAMFWLFEAYGIDKHEAIGWAIRSFGVAGFIAAILAASIPNS